MKLEPADKVEHAQDVFTADGIPMLGRMMNTLHTAEDRALDVDAKLAALRIGGELLHGDCAAGMPRSVSVEHGRATGVVNDRIVHDGVEHDTAVLSVCLGPAQEAVEISSNPRRYLQVLIRERHQVDVLNIYVDVGCEHVLSITHVWGTCGWRTAVSLLEFPTGPLSCS
jgi:hypothetical protein